MTEIFIIGAGASGMIAAIEASKEALKLEKKVNVTILEHNNTHGRKLLATGNGRCNLTNRQLNVSCFRSHDMERLATYLNTDNNDKPDKVISYFEGLGMMCTDKNGYIYPYSCQASTVNDILFDSCLKYGVKFIFDAHVLEVKPHEAKGYVVKTSEGYTDEAGNRKKKRNEYRADKVVMACGSKAYPKLGADGSSYKLVSDMGLKIVDIVPALTGLKCRGKYFELASGARTNVKLSLYVDHELTAVDKGELQLTDYGISGIPVFQISRYASYGLADGCKVHCDIDFMQEYSSDKVLEMIAYNIKLRKESDIYTVLCGMLNNRIVHMILAYCKIDESIKGCNITDIQIKDIVEAIKAFYAVIVGTNDYEQSQICAGGVKLSEVDENFESVKMPDLYITGELLDVDGMCGGYNLHWAWISGMTAGRNVVKG